MTTSIADQIERLQVAGFQCIDRPSTDSDKSESVRARLRATGWFNYRGGKYSFKPYDQAEWELPDSWTRLVETGGFDIKAADGTVLISILGPLSAVLATEDLIDALNDHREFEWAHEQLEPYGLDRCVVFATRPGWMEGWAFDTRFPDADNETVIRPIFDFSADDSAMQREWVTVEDVLDPEVTRFENWFRDRVDELCSSSTKG